jgi:hypothetical protein
MGSPLGSAEFSVLPQAACCAATAAAACAAPCACASFALLGGCCLWEE